MATNFNPNYAVHPGRILAEDIRALKMTQVELANRIGVQKSLINEIIKGKRSINAKIAVLLEKVIDEPAGFWLQLQSKYDEIIARIDLEKAKEKTHEEIVCTINTAREDLNIQKIEIKVSSVKIQSQYSCNPIAA